MRIESVARLSTAYAQYVRRIAAEENHSGAFARAQLHKHDLFRPTDESLPSIETFFSAMSAQDMTAHRLPLMCRRRREPVRKRGTPARLAESLTALSRNTS
jgi:hypothetical protein